MFLSLHSCLCCSLPWIKKKSAKWNCMKTQCIILYHVIESSRNPDYRLSVLWGAGYCSIEQRALEPDDDWYHLMARWHQIQRPFNSTKDLRGTNYSACPHSRSWLCSPLIWAQSLFTGGKAAGWHHKPIWDPTLLPRLRLHSSTKRDGRPVGWVGWGRTFSSESTLHDACLLRRAGCITQEEDGKWCRKEDRKAAGRKK